MIQLLKKFFAFIVLSLFLIELAKAGSMLPDSMQLMVKNNPQKALKILSENATQFKKYNDYPFLVAMANCNLGKHVKSDSLLTAFMQQTSFKNDSLLYIRCLHLKAENARILDHFEETLLSLSKIYDYYKRQKNDSGMVQLYISFAEYYRSVNNFDMAISYLDKANTLGNAMSDGFPMLVKARMMNRRAAVFAEFGINTDSVVVLSKEVIRLATIFDDPLQVATACNELGYYFSSRDKHLPQAELYLKQAIDIWDSLEYHIYSNNAQINLARLYVRLGKCNDAINLAMRGFENVKKYDWKWEEGYWYEILSMAYGKSKQYKEAYIYTEKAKERLLMNAYHQYNERLAYFSKQLDLKEKEEELILKQDEIYRTSQELRNKSNENKMLFSLLLALVLVLVVSILGIVYTNRQKRIVNEQKNQIAKINHALEESIGLKDVLLKEINHRVKNNLSMLSGLMYLKEMDAGNEETVNTLHDMRSRIHTISLIHETLYQNNITVDVDFHEYLLKLSEQIINIYSGSVSSEVRLNVHCKGLALDLSKAISLAMIVNELITNSLKHAFHHTTQPMIHIGYSEETHTFDYFDNGPGFENEEKAGSHGTKLMAIFARQLDATFSYKRENNYLITSLKFNKPIPNSGNL